MGESVVSLLRLPVAAGSEESFMAAFETLEIFEYAAQRVGMRAARLLRPVQPGEPFVVIGEWDTEDDYDRWLADPMREELRLRLLPLLDGETSGALFRTTLAWE
jgi:heme-degrading monooxygenase HmoA